jgi:hypothetical protein
MKKIFAIVALTAAVAFLPSCTPPYRQTFNDEGKAKGWTQKQTDAAFAYADRIYLSREVGENKYVIAYGRIPTSKVRTQLEGVLKDLDGALDPKNEEMKQYLATFNLRKDMEHDEEVTQAVYDRVRAAELQTQFKQEMGDLPDYGPEAEMAQGYNVRKIFVAKSLAEAFPFSSDQIDAAKKAGTLKEIATATYDESVLYDHKVPDPKYPDDTNEFVWKGRKQAVELHEYKIVDIDKPLDNKGDYIEGYRVIEGKKESQPALKVFFPPSGSMALVLVSSEEEGQPGFGIPDVLEEMSAQTNVQDLIQNNNLINSLFDKKEAKKNRVIQEAQLFKVEIAPIGAHVEEWQKCPDENGCIIPFKYANLKGDNYNVRIKMKVPKVDPENPGDHSHNEYMQIEYIAKEYTKTGDQYEPSAGKVLEYFRPRSEFAGKVKAKVQHYDDTKKVTFEFEDGSVVDGFVAPGKSKFIEDKPYAKSYNEGQKRWWIESSNNDGKYDKRKPVGQPKERTGEYNEDSMEEAFRAESAAGKDGMNDMKTPIKKETGQAPPSAKQ